MSSQSFRFRRFEVFHDRCAMKVGTDGVLLGAWTGQTVQQQAAVPHSVLDIGTGSGLVALMLAQQFSSCEIRAIDIEAAAVEQAAFNFARSPWAERLRSEQATLQTYVSTKSFDLIVSNPPYFENSLKNPDKGRELARHTDSLPYADLVAHTARLLSPEGMAAYILPAEAETNILSLTAAAGLFPVRLTRVHSKAGKPAKRILAVFRFLSTPMLVSPEVFYIEGDGTPRSHAYADLTREFYL